MTPRFAVHDVSDSCQSYSKPDGYLGERNLALQFADFTYLILSQSGMPISLTGKLQSNVIGVLCVLGASRPFKILRAAMCFVPVAVIDFRAMACRWIKEGQRYETVQGVLAPLIVDTQPHVDVSRLLEHRPADVAAINTFHPSTVADFVPAFVADDRAPFFGGGMVGTHRKPKPFGVMQAGVPRSAPASLYPEAA